ncbi:uncharacterized protein LOC125515083 [Triticum urartu]|uniref:uncharacterized protein LOC125515083 n=1 Tax=Triticum urartu TaxID=4572 RepID=UPI002042CCD7|nr:uncharacterized protein LOC125515083 [Triticum urartu]
MEAKRRRFDDMANKMRMEATRREEEAEDREYFTGLIQDMERSGTVTKEMPNAHIGKYHDLLEKLWGWDRLLSMGDSALSWSDYSAYLEECHRRNVDAVSSIAALAQTCLISEEQFVSEWKTQMKSQKDVILLTRKSTLLSCLIHECARSVVHAAGRGFSDLHGSALLCIAKEADLTRALLRCGNDPVDDYLIDQSREIRTCALSLMNCTSDNSVAASAAMLGIAKETGIICAWISENNKPVDLCHYSVPDEIEDSRRIRYQTFNVMIDILEESSAAARHKIDKEEPASRNGPGGDGDGIAAAGTANTTGYGFSSS